ncbi:hypothetical protein [Kangiella sp. TOML190]|uniref:hypothetical protein n=1 Tax=Kangiella sp. TOML190 TaxID=2931351 RepID=UPI002040073C|nr:hypothetical protein [Kangiella sp. TOML190]
MADFSLTPQLRKVYNDGLVNPIDYFGSLNHLYGYVDQNPVMGVDPTGLSSERAGLMAAIGRGDVRSIRMFMDLVTDPKLRAAGQKALDKFGSKAKDWIGKNCKGSINREFPQQFRDMTLEQIRNGRGADYKKAWKLLNDKRFRK